jgi:type I restriction enzyme M protein
MSSQASSAGGNEAAVRQKLVETGAVDVMIDIRGNFFYTRTVPCQLWFFDRAKEKDKARRDHVLMLDARQIYRKVSRSVCDFSPEQQKNIAAIVWLYRGEQARFLKLVESYLDDAVTLGGTADGPLQAGPWGELTGAQATLTADIAAFCKDASAQAKAWAKATRDNVGLNAARAGLHPLSERCRDLTKQIDLAVKLSGRVIDIAVKELGARDADAWNSSDVNKARKALDEARAAAVEALRQARYFVKQADWLQERFPDAVLRDVEGLVKRVDRTAIKASDWSLTPGRYVGVAPEEVDEEFDFEEALRALHIDLKGLNEEAAELAARIAKNFEELGA